MQVNTYHTPTTCSRKVEVSDFVRYHYNGTLLDGTLFDSRWASNDPSVTRLHRNAHTVVCIEIFHLSAPSFAVVTPACVPTTPTSGLGG